MMNFKQLLRSKLLDTRITTLINNNVFFLHKPEDIKATTYVEYRILKEQYDDYCGDKALAINYNIQIDIFSKTDYENLRQVIIEVLEQYDYRFYDGVELFENDTKLYHCALRFNKKIMKTK